MILTLDYIYLKLYNKCTLTKSIGSGALTHI